MGVRTRQWNRWRRSYRVGWSLQRHAEPREVNSWRWVLDGGYSSECSVGMAVTGRRKGDDGVYVTHVICLYIPSLWSYVTAIVVDTVVSRWYMCIDVLYSLLDCGCYMPLTLMSGQTDNYSITDDCKSRIEKQSIEGLEIWIRQTNGRVCCYIITVE